MASDLPPIEGYRGSVEMARVLVTYLTDDKVIAQAVRAEFAHGIGIGIGTIRELRAEHVKRQQRPAEAPHKPHDGYYPADASDRAAVISKCFLTALEAERDLSAHLARSLGALKSPLLERPDLVNKAYEREIEQAMRSNSELGR